MTRPALGAHVRGNATHFGAYTTTSDVCAVRFFDERGQALETLPMRDAGDGFFELSLGTVGHGALYKLVLGDRELPDPYARFLPHGVHGPAMVVETHYELRHPRGPRRALSEQVLYELHVGTFTEQGTYAAARARLGELAQLGVTTLELMPVAAFAGQRGWGYDDVAGFAPFAPYGTPDELRAFVDEAHALGLDVLLDVVYNHFGPAGNYLRAYAPEYFTSDVQNAWGDAPDFAHPVMRAYVLDNARMWLESFRFDGLRLDAVHAIVDRSEPHVLDELTRELRALDPSVILIAEDERHEPALITRTRLDAMWADDFHHQVRVTLTGERDGYYASYEPGVADLARVIERGWLYEGQVDASTGKPRGKPADELPASAFVYCIQNHDQIGNRALGDRLSDVVSLDAYCMASTLLLFLPMTPLLFMGQEWAASTPFLYFTDHEPELGAKVSAGRREEFKRFRAFSDPATRASIPDPQAVETFERSRLRWSERVKEPHARVLALYTDLLELRRTDPVLSRSYRAGLSARAHGSTLVVRRRYAGEQRVLVASFGSSPVALDDVGVAPDAEVLLASSPGFHHRALEPLTAVIVASATFDQEQP